MKKILILSLIISTALTANSYAKTQGVLVGVSYVLTHAKYKEVLHYKETVTNKTFIGKRYSHNFNGAAIDLKYAVNVNNFFIAPGIFYEQSSFGGDDSSRKNSNPKDVRGIQVQQRFGAKVDLGYDINYYLQNGRRTVSPFVTGGYGAIKYKSKAALHDFAENNKNETTVNEDYDLNWFIGGGMKFDVTNNIAINTEYNWQKADFKSQRPDRLVKNYHPARYKAALHILKVGIVAKF